MKVLDPLPVDFWQAVARACPWATYFHTPGWAAVMLETFPGFEAASLGFELDGGARAVVPCVARRKKGLLRSGKDCKSMEPGVYGGIIADRDLVPGEAEAIARFLLGRKNTTGRLVETPFRRFGLSGLFLSKDRTTHVVDLCEDYDAVRKKFSRGQKSNLNQARRRQVAVRRAESREDIGRYLDIYRQTLQRWGDTTLAVYPDLLFYNLYGLDDPGVMFWLAEADGAVVAGAVVLAWQQTMVYWHGCALRQHFKLYPNNLLHAAVIQWGCANGYSAYDMGASMDLEGVRRFKESFGARPRDYTSYRWK